MATTLAEILPEAAARHGERTALIIGDRHLSFSELEALSNKVANGLVALGVKPGDRISLFGGNSWEWVAAYHGIAKTGAVLNPLSSMLTTDELRYTIGDAGARVVVAASDKIEQLQALKTDGIVDHLVPWGSGDNGGTPTLETWLRAGDAAFTPRAIATHPTWL